MLLGFNLKFYFLLFKVIFYGEWFDVEPHFRSLNDVSVINLSAYSA